jgi:cytochrome c oxidase assembly factor CtaG/putative copper export protein
MVKIGWIIGPSVFLAAAALALFVALGVGGSAAPLLVADPGPVVRFALPVGRLLVNLGAAGMLGALALACFALDPGEKSFDRALDVAAASSAFFVISSVVCGVLAFLDISGERFSFDDSFGNQLFFFLANVELGRAWAVTAAAGAAVTVLCCAVRNHTALLFVMVLSCACLIPLALQGHVVGSSGHDAALSALLVHVVFAAVWLGGIFSFLFLRSCLNDIRMHAVLYRFSSLALVCFVAVAVSGYVSAQLRVGSLENFFTPYGILIFLKVVALLGLGVLGALHRRFVVGRMFDTITRRGASTTGLLWWLITGELIFMGIASGVAPALARTAPPAVAVSTASPTPAQLLTGEPLPPPLTLNTFLAQWDIDTVWLLVCGFGVFFYLAGVWRVKRRGDTWPIHRTILWCSGMFLLFYVTCGGLKVYETYLFSVHMVGHMVLTMMVPILLVPAAPVTLALRSIRRRNDGSRGAREWILRAVRSRAASILTNPLVTASLFVASLWAFYYTPLFRWAVEDHIGHEWMVIHFLVSGYLFVQSLIGVDPVPHRTPYPFRLLLLLATMAFHAFFGLGIMTGTGLLLADWYGAMGRNWGLSAIADQKVGGGIVWGIGELPSGIPAMILVTQWSRSDAKETRRKDRHADRTGHVELAEYNSMLARLAARNAPPS